jgi:hypothetical protein
MKIKISAMSILTDSKQTEATVEPHSVHTGVTEMSPLETARAS